MLDALQHSQYSFNLSKKNDTNGTRLTSNLNSNKMASNLETISLSYTPEEIERMKLCGILFDRRSSVKKDLIDEFFRKEPCLYDQSTYKSAARIFHCLKVDLNENPILKSLKQEQQKDEEQNKVAEVPKIQYKNNQDKKNTLKLAFSVLRFQRLLEQLFDDCQFYAKYPDSKDEQSLACTILFDYMMRKFQQRELNEEELAERDKLVSVLETYIYQEKTHLAAALARNRIKSDALTVEELLPMELREVEQHRAELPLYCWVNVLKAEPDAIVQHFINNEGLKLVEGKELLDHRCFMLDPHCPNLLTFHYTLRNRIMNHEFVRDFKLIVQDKSSCLAPHTINKLLYKRDDVILTHIGGGLVAAYLGCMMKELEGRVYVYGATSDEKYEEIAHKLQQIGCSKYVKIIREDFINVKFDDSKLDNVKVILINAPCSKSALMNPMEFLFQEGEDVRLLRDFSIDFKNESRIRKAVQNENLIIKHALRFPHVRAIVYQTYSKHSVENEQVVTKALQEFNDTRRTTVFPYKISPPVIPITMTDLQNDELARGVKYLQFKPSNKMNGCFIALLSRDKDAKVDKEARKAEALIEKKARAAAIAAAEAEEKAEFSASKTSSSQNSEENFSKKKSAKKPTIKKKGINVKKAIVGAQSKPTIDEQILRLQNRDSEKHSDKPDTGVPQPVIINTLESRLANIGKLKQEQPQQQAELEDDKYEVSFLNQPIHMKQYEFQFKKKAIPNLEYSNENINEITLDDKVMFSLDDTSIDNSHKDEQLRDENKLTISENNYIDDVLNANRKKPTTENLFTKIPSKNENFKVKTSRTINLASPKLHPDIDFVQPLPRFLYKRRLSRRLSNIVEESQNDFSKLFRKQSFLITTSDKNNNKINEEPIISKLFEKKLLTERNKNEFIPKSSRSSYEYKREIYPLKDILIQFYPPNQTLRTSKDLKSKLPVLSARKQEQKSLISVKINDSWLPNPFLTTIKL